MKILLASAALLLAVSQVTGQSATHSSISNPHSSSQADPFLDAVKVWHFGNDEGLKKQGSASAGVRMKGKDLAASRKRGGDGYAATFDGGWLVTEPGINVTGKQMTFLIRLRASADNWKGSLFAREQAADPYANLLYSSSLDLNQLGFRERQRLKDNRSIEFLWHTDSLSKQVIPEFLSNDENNPYQMSRDSLGRNKTWTQQVFPSLYPLLRDGILKVAAPRQLIDPGSWHDVLIRFTGPHLDLFIDGELIDKEYPHGFLRYFQSPFLIGAGYENNSAVSGFRGLMDHVAIWDRALSDGEIATLSGKPVQPTGDAWSENLHITTPQYWRPPAYNEFFGDPMPFFHDSLLHIYYLLDRKHHAAKWGAGAHPWGHLSSKDLRNWTIHPLAMDITKQIESSLGTGNVIFHNGKYYAYWINHGRRLAYTDAPEHFLFDNIYVGTSVDGIHFDKQEAPAVRIDYKSKGDVNPVVWRSATADRFYMYISGPPKKENWYFESEDLLNWRPATISALDQVHAACCSYYPWKGRYYWFDWRKGYQSSARPIEEPGARLTDLVPMVESWAVPQAVPFTGNRMLMMAFTVPVAAYGSMALTRELIKNEDGSLGFTWPVEMIPATDKSLNLKIHPNKGKLSGGASSFKLSAEQNSAANCFMEKIPANVRITMRVVPGQGASGFGVGVRGNGDYTNAKELHFDPEKKQFRYALPGGVSLPPLKYGHAPNSLEAVTGLDKPFQLDIIVKDDFVDVCIDQRYTLFHHRPDDFNTGDRLFFFVQKGSVVFDSVQVRPLN